MNQLLNVQVVGSFISEICPSVQFSFLETVPPIRIGLTSWHG